MTSGFPLLYFPPSPTYPGENERHGPIFPSPGSVTSYWGVQMSDISIFQIVFDARWSVCTPVCGWLSSHLLSLSRSPTTNGTKSTSLYVSGVKCFSTNFPNDISVPLVREICKVPLLPHWLRESCSCPTPWFSFEFICNRIKKGERWGEKMSH